MAEGQISGSYMWARNGCHPDRRTQSGAEGSAALFVYSIFIEMQYEFIRPGTIENIGFSVGAD